MQDGEVVTVSVGVELTSDVRHVVTSFLENHRVEAPLEHGEAILIVHEIANQIGERDVKVGLGNTKA